MKRFSRRDDERRHLRAQYGWLYDELTEILFAHDPIRISYLSLKAGEYDYEARLLLLNLWDADSPRLLRRIIYEVFVRCFTAEEAGGERDYGKIARDVWAARVRWGRACSLRWLEAVADRFRVPRACLWWSYGRDVDLLSVRFTLRSSVMHSADMEDGIIINDNASHEIVGCEVLDVSRDINRRLTGFR